MRSSGPSAPTRAIGVVTVAAIALVLLAAAALLLLQARPRAISPDVLDGLTSPKSFGERTT